MGNSNELHKTVNNLQDYGSLNQLQLRFNVEKKTSQESEVRRIWQDYLGEVLIGNDEEIDCSGTLKLVNNTGLHLKNFFQRSRFSQRFLYIFCMLNSKMYLISLNQVNFLCAISILRKKNN